MMHIFVRSIFLSYARRIIFIFQARELGNSPAEAIKRFGAAFELWLKRLPSWNNVKCWELTFYPGRLTISGGTGGRTMIMIRALIEVIMIVMMTGIILQRGYNYRNIAIEQL